MSYRLLSMFSVAICLLLLFPGEGAKAEDNTYREDFTTKQFCDTIQTTALWDTVAGELRLPPLPIITGTLYTEDIALRVAVSGSYAFVAERTAGLLVVDITDPAMPTLTGTLSTASGATQDVAVAGEYAYVADYTTGLLVVNIVNPANPTLTGTYNTLGYAYGVTLWGHYALVADGTAGLLVIDIANPANPTLVGTCDTPGNARQVAACGNYAYVADYNYGLQVIDLSNPGSPSLAGTYDTQGNARAVAVAGHHAFVADYGSGLQVIDITNPSLPTLAGNLDTPGNAVGVTLTDEFAFVADGIFGLQVIDITDPNFPVLQASQDTPGSAFGVSVWGDYAYVADYEAGLQVVRLSEIVTPELGGGFDTDDTVGGVAVAGNYLYLPNSDNGLKILDITDPDSPVQVGQYDTNGYAHGVSVQGQYAYVADWDAGLLILDITNPANPAYVGACDTPGSAGYAAISGQYVYVTDGYSGLQVIKVANPGLPVLVASFTLPDHAYKVAIQGNYAFVACGSGGLQVVNIADPTHPTLASSYNTADDYVFDVVVAGQFAYLADYDLGCQVIYYPSPNDPVWISRATTLGNPLGIAISGDHVVIAEQFAGLEVFDITNPYFLVKTGDVDTPGRAYGVEVSGDHAFVADYDSGLQVAKIRQHLCNSERNTGRSLPINSGPDTILRVKLTPDQIGQVSWEASANNGGYWTGIGYADWWIPLEIPGSELVWRAWLQPSTDGPAGSSVCSSVDLEWLYEFAPIAMIADVPDDQGGWVRLGFTRSGHDFADVGALAVTGYWIHQRIDSAELMKRVLEEGAPADGAALMNASPELGELGDLRLLGDRTFIVNLEKTQSSFPPGIWEVVGSAPALQQDNYSVRVPCLADSTEAGASWSTFLVTTHTSDPAVWFACHPDSGYSVDNIAPAVPGGFTLAANSVLTWNSAPVPDFQYFTVYGSAADHLDETALLLAYTTDTSLDVSGQTFNHFLLTASDHAGNQSEAAVVNLVTAAADALPRGFALNNCVPNPFNPSTRLSFDLAAGGRASLKVYDAAGRLVATLLDEHRDAGHHQVTWDGRDDRGRRCPAGVYLYHLEVGNFSQTKQMVLVK